MDTAKIEVQEVEELKLHRQRSTREPKTSV